MSTQYSGYGSSLPDEFDIIVAGGGSCGCVVAGRLANLDHNLKVLLIEAGESNLNNPWVFRPGIYPRNMKLDSKTASFYESRPSKWLAGRKAVVPCAHVLGGGSSINFMMYTRASASDYDDFQAKGWTTQELLPLMRKHETYQRASQNREIHGFEGPIKVSFGNYTYPIKDDFLRAAESQGIPVVDDLQDLVTGHGAEHWLKWINRDTGRRSDTCSTKVDKVIIENGRAVGVQTVPTKHLGSGQPPTRIFRARKQIVVSGGTLSSPLILQRSGIDHYLTFSVFRAKPDVETFDDFVRGDPEVQKRVFDEWHLKGTGPLATNGIDAGVKIRPTEQELKEFESWPTPHFKDGWKSYFKDKPDKPVMHYSVISGWFGDHMLMPPGKFFTMFHFLEYPFSRGSTHIKSADPYDSPDFDCGFMNDERDMVPMVWGYIKSRETARRMDAYAGEVETMHPFFEYDSPARAHDMDLATTKAYALPGNLSAGITHGSWSSYLPEADTKAGVNILSSNKVNTRQELKYNSNDIKAIEEWVKRHVESTWHSLGTCSMAPKEGNSIVKHGVLDERLNVHGVKGLKVADLSICPDNVGCNTYSTALLIGEKAAMLVAEDLGYSGEALEMKVPTYHAPGELALQYRL
ncbi:GMC oxidoreductase domain-containing protein [Trichoderma breve]|uniref:GMC oxidoreductase domain-containing protein n=1 Tax=Trichoderma breve TaxID=2034170 RepID=A0A9W9BEI0_9HYPO|nr:GMC oxidoreductase domain-containing protein [Trichoderma breve]KAJ4858101.1 GMC oxidoreductase domain-containing protein [Trichoderma breve]